MHLTNRNKNTKMHRHGEMVKENVFEDGVVPLRWVIAAAVVTALSLAVAALVDHRLPEPLDRTAPPDRFIAEIAHEHLVNLTSIGPRVTGSYENEVLAVQILVEAVKSIAAQASPHNRIDYDVFSASGAFSLTFLDGMSNVYRDVQSVVVRARGAGGRPAAVRTALLLNCHFDTVPDSPGASDDAAGCAVALETLRALVAAPRPLRHDVLVLLNGAEENILQASHAFVTQHPWAKSVRAFINIEACGAGGREVLFQAGPHDPWIMEVYAGAVPHPFASSLAQELFESGLIPADTDFRIFRDYGNLSGVDLAWNSNGYVYHTHLDTAARVPPAALQRTGDNVLALALGLLSNERLERPTERERQPVFFDVVGAFVIAARAPAAALAVIVTLATLALSLHFSAAEAAKRLYISRRAWWWVVLRAARNVALTQGAGAAAALVPALLLHATGARLSFYASPALLVPLYALPALCGAWADSRFAWRGRLAPARGWWEWRAWRDALALWAGAMLAAGALAGLRSAFLPLLWTLPALAALPRCSPATSAALHAALSALPALQSAYLALGSVDMFVPIMGRAGTAPLPADVMMSLVVSSLTLTTFSWMLPLVVAARKPAPLIYACALVSALTCALVLLTPLGAPYSAERPQRIMVFHTRRTLHGPEPVVENFYWLPELDVNTPHSLDEHVDGMRAARAGSAEECARWVYCGAPYYLPVLSLVARGHRLPAPAPPLAELRVRAELRADGPLARTLALELDGPSHVVVILAPAAGARVTRCSELEGAPQPGPPWAARRTYFLALHRARRPRPPRPWRLECRLERADAEGEGEGEGEGAPWVQVSAAGHAMSGAAQRHERHAALLAALPASAAATGWGVDLHLLEL